MSLRKKNRPSDLMRAKEELDALRTALREAYRRFDNVSDPDITEACIYEIRALRSRYSCTLKRARALYH